MTSAVDKSWCAGHVHDHEGRRDRTSRPFLRRGRPLPRDPDPSVTVTTWPFAKHKLLWCSRGSSTWCSTFVCGHGSDQPGHQTNGVSSQKHTKPSAASSLWRADAGSSEWLVCESPPNTSLPFPQQNTQRSAMRQHCPQPRKTLRLGACLRGRQKSIQRPVSQTRPRWFGVVCEGHALRLPRFTASHPRALHRTRGSSIPFRPLTTGGREHHQPGTITAQKEIRPDRHNSGGADGTAPCRVAPPKTEDR